MSTKVVGAIVGVILVGAVAVGAALLISSSADPDRALALVPADALGYADVVLDPGLLQRRELGALIDRFGIADDPEHAVGLALQAALDPLGLDYETQVEPWLGDVAAAFVIAQDLESEPSFAALIATSDPDAAGEAVRAVAASQAGAGPWEPRSHRETEYFTQDDLAYGFLDDFLVVGDEHAFQAAVDAREDGESLAGVARVRDALAELGADALARVVVDGEALTELLAASGMPGMLSTPMGMTGFAVSATADAVIFDAISAGADDLGFTFAVEADALGSLPSGSFLALALPPLGPLLTSALDNLGDVAVPGLDSTFIEDGFRAQTGLDLRDDVLSWMGSGGFFARGDSLLALGGGLVVESDNPPATEAFVDAVGALLAGFGAPLQPVERSGLRGFAISELGVPAPVELLGGERLVLGYGDAAGAFGSSALADDEAFRAALGHLPAGYTPVAYLDLAAARAFGENLAEQFLGPLPPEYVTEVRPYLEPLGTMIAGSHDGGEWTRQRLILSVADSR